MLGLPQTPLARRRRHRAGLVVLTVVILAGVLLSRGGGGGGHLKTGGAGTAAANGTNPQSEAAHPGTTGLATPSSYAPGVPPNRDPNNVYSYDGVNMLSPEVAGDLVRVYVPNTESSSVSVIDPATNQVIQTIPVGFQPQHVSPSWDLKTLWVENDK